MVTEAGPEALTPAARDVIVVGHDGSEQAGRALHQAVGLAMELTCRVRVVRAFSLTIDPSPVMADVGWVASPDELKAGIESALHDDIADEIASSPDLDIEAIGVLGPAAQALVIASDGARMLVVGSRGRGGFTQALLGSVSGQCVQHANCPVLVTR